MSLIRQRHRLILWLWLILTWDSCRPMFFWQPPLHLFWVLSGRGNYLSIFLNKYVTFVIIRPLPPHELILYPVRVSQLMAQNVDATKHCQKLSYFAKWRYSFTKSLMLLDSFLSNNHISLLYKWTIVKRENNVASASEVAEEEWKWIDPQWIRGYLNTTTKKFQ